MPPRRDATIDPAIWQQLEPLRETHQQILDDPRAIARLLCGIATPWLTKAKLTRDPIFGRLEHVPFAAVLHQAQQLLTQA